VTRIVPHIHRVGGTSVVNSYLLEESGEVTIIDVGAPCYWRKLPAAAVRRVRESVTS
jgi:hypothetical protein